MVFIFVCYRCQEPILTAQLFLSFLIMPWGSSEIYYFLLSVYQFPLSIKQNPVLDEGGGGSEGSDGIRIIIYSELLVIINQLLVIINIMLGYYIWYY